jgi:hypothetical protein
MLRIAHCLDNQLTDGGKVVSPIYSVAAAYEIYIGVKLKANNFCKLHPPPVIHNVNKWFDSVFNSCDSISVYTLCGEY